MPSMSTPPQTPPMALPTLSMAGKVCMVTGGARGLGFEFCRAFVQSGCTSVVILDLRESDTIEAAAELSRFAVSLGFSEKDINFIGISCDVSSEEAVITAYNMIMEKFGRIDAVVASAGVVENYSALDYPAERVKFLFDINFHGVLYTAREAARRMIPNGGGSVILISSMSASIVNIPQAQAPYNASKAAVKHLAASLAVEWAKDGVRVNCISPGYMLTKLTKQVLSKDPALKATWETMTPMGRMGDPSDLSGAVVLLASDASKFITGTEIKVDGGYCAI